MNRNPEQKAPFLQSTRRESDECNSPLVLLSLGRSGSTFLQRLLNCIDGMYMFGEHAGLLASAAEFHQVIANDQTPAVFGNYVLDKMCFEAQFIAWACPFRGIEFVNAYRRLINELYVSKLPERSHW